MITAVDFSRALGAKFVGQTNIGISPELDLVFGGLTLGAAFLLLRSISVAFGCGPLYPIPIHLPGAFGCLSTVSTFVNELRLLPPLQAIQYGGLTMLLGQLVSVPIFIGFRVLDDT